MTTLIEFNAVLAAAERLAGKVIRTPTIAGSRLAEKIQRPVFLKLENTQLGGSFKARGVLNKFLSLKGDFKKTRFVAVSGGNFGIAIAEAAKIFGANVTIIMPPNAPATSVDRVRDLGSSVIIESDVHAAFERAKVMADEGYVVIDDCNDSLIAEGHGTLALEFIADCPELTDVFIAVGGGGMLAGAATALKAIKPDIRIWGVETAGASSMHQALRAGKPVNIDVTSIISTLGVPIIDEMMLAHAQAYAEDIVVVSDKEAIGGMLAFGEQAKLWVELASGALIPAVIATAPRLPADAVIGIVVCGGNISHHDMAKWVAYSQEL
ncbi:Pyridoxal-5'-phosphate-dependent protein beta subunit [Serratia sp. AS12]|uniref:threonine ammonia-lyase n=1 Tax=Serratia TaxID=613 RepID=UPI00020E91CD|nr:MULTISPECIES: pyridoxal-phosphate dependent enzyme [Serratia]AEF44744.1 Pyridoxal-5'-phosphate-dependent protein beta subunit [Serratia plymuthica AS9]AEF49696.1 Pyridoxal-5'-phosphate-dependent protein beta subunit [Serratia sp. AS12]AEG27403.1 Pyridoxal-5'-phosphate-dependent protein beta subunit [Serratia sp. AS13]UTN98243.1 pyridoxal-phosphate dependent enzyme [Serratia plymuthica]